MPLFESGYRAAAKTELERDIREIEAKDKAAQTRQDFQNGANEVQSNIDFAQRLNLINQEQAEAMRERVKKAMENQQFMRNEGEEIVDDYENPRERAGRYFNMDEANAEISREKAEASRTGQEQTQTEQIHVVTDERERN